ncbi:DNA processing protein [Pseudomonas sp. IT-232MI5]|uniref:DNA-processing protein DprA n=1 Tax=Pseudomonas sp. IT-232MI5 TaxID=3026442 RepID=UPI0039E14193
MHTNIFSHLLALALIKNGIPGSKIAAVLDSFSTQELSSRLDSNDANFILARSYSNNLLNISAKDWDDAKWTHDKNLSHNVRILSINENEYPKYLKSILDAPPLLFIRGNFDIFSHLPGVAIVGAREASPAGKEIAKRIARFMGENGWTVVSGLALGIDAAAHQGALDAGGKTIAVLAGGLEKANPAANLDLGFNILESGGAWISEHPVGTPPKKHHFVPRNRIQVGLSAGSIIVEAKIKSGSLSQARFCVGQDRPLFAVVPNTVENPLRLNSEGTIHMVEDLGAIPVRTKNDYPKILSRLKDQQIKITSN